MEGAFQNEMVPEEITGTWRRMRAGHWRTLATHREQTAKSSKTFSLVAVHVLKVFAVPYQVTIHVVRSDARRDPSSLAFAKESLSRCREWRPPSSCFRRLR